jgi:hypothetical protein
MGFPFMNLAGNPGDYVFSERTMDEIMSRLMEESAA